MSTSAIKIFASWHYWTHAIGTTTSAALVIIGEAHAPRPWSSRCPDAPVLYRLRFSRRHRNYTNFSSPLYTGSRGFTFRKALEDSCLRVSVLTNRSIRSWLYCRRRPQSRMSARVYFVSLASIENGESSRSHFGQSLSSITRIGRRHIRPGLVGSKIGQWRESGY